MPILPNNPDTRAQLMRLAPLIVLLLFSLLLASGLLNQSDKAPKESYLIGNHVTDFTVPSLTGGAAITPELWKNKIVVINLFASWCEPCVAEHPALMKLAQSGKVEMVGIAWRDKKDDTIAWLKKHGNPFHHIGLDTSGKTSIVFGLTGVPETMIIDHKGVIAYNHKAPIDEEMVDTVIIPMIEYLRERHEASMSR